MPIIICEKFIDSICDILGISLFFHDMYPFII